LTFTPPDLTSTSPDLAYSSLQLSISDTRLYVYFIIFILSLLFISILFNVAAVFTLLKLQKALNKNQVPDSPSNDIPLTSSMESIYHSSNHSSGSLNV
jgi:hypothetical protein